MGCGSCGRGRTAIKTAYKVKFKDGRPDAEFDTALQANAEARRAGGGTVRAVQKK